MPLTDTEFNQLQIWIGIVDFQRINNLVMHRANPMDMTSSCPRPVKTRQHNSEIGTWEVLVPVGRTIVEIRLDRKRRKEKKKENAERQKHSISLTFRIGLTNRFDSSDAGTFQPYRPVQIPCEQCRMRTYVLDRVAKQIARCSGRMRKKRIRKRKKTLVSAGKCFQRINIIRRSLTGFNSINSPLDRV